MPDTNTNPPQLPVYTDAFTLPPGIWGAEFDFGVHQRGDAPPLMHTKVAMSLDHAKVMAYMTVRQILRFEEQTKVSNVLSDVVLQQIVKCTREQWTQFWYGWKTGAAFGGYVIPKETSASDGQVPAPTTQVPL